MLTMIYASTAYNIIGDGNKLPWKCSSDLKFFKLMTKNSICIVGRKTFDSFWVPGFDLAGRLFVIVSHNRVKSPDKHCVYVDSVERAFEKSTVLSNLTDKPIVVIGGKSIYEQTLEFVDDICIYQTVIPCNPVIKDPVSFNLITKRHIKAKDEYLTLIDKGFDKPVVVYRYIV